MHTQLKAALSISLGLLPLAGCTVDSNARTTLGGERASTLAADDGNIVTLSALADSEPGALTQSSSLVIGVDRSDWATTRFMVPAYEVRHGAFIGSRTLIASDTPRFTGQVPTTDSALNFNRDETRWPQILEVPLVFYSFGQDVAAGISRVVRYGPSGWHASPRWGGERTFGDKPGAFVEAAAMNPIEAE